jgi:hypothetical protein
MAGGAANLSSDLASLRRDEIDADHVWDVRSGNTVVDLAKDPCRMGSLARSTTETTVFLVANGRRLTSFYN